MALQRLLLLSAREMATRTAWWDSETEERNCCASMTSERVEREQDWWCETKSRRQRTLQDLGCRWLGLESEGPY